MGGRGFNRVDEEEAASVNQFLDGEAEHLDELLPNGHRTWNPNPNGRARRFGS